MAFTSTTENVAKEKKEQGFPKLMIDDMDRIVLFNSLGYGTLVGKRKSSISGLKIGYSADDWNKENFKDYTGRVVLEQTDD